MIHCSDDDLVLHYYGEPGADAAHIEACGVCSARYRELASLLTTVRTDVPARDGDYGSQVWHRIEPELKADLFSASAVRARAGRRLTASWISRRSVRWTLAAAATLALLVSGYVAGRFSTPPAAVAPARVAQHPVDADAPRRVLLLTVAEHLERSDRVLTDIMNGPESGDMRSQQQWAEDLIAANRLYRQDALDANEPSIAGVLDELERALLDIVHRPSNARPEELEQIRQRIDSAALLFKVRFMSHELRQGPPAELTMPSTRPTRSIG